MQVKMLKKKHKFLSFTKKYGRYKMYMTQHMFVGIGSKKYGPVNWVIFLDDQHIVLNTYINETRVKIDEAFMDEHWNVFCMKLNYKIDVWKMVEGCDIEKFNDYREHLLPHAHDNTLTDIDDLMHKVDVADKQKRHVLRKADKIKKKMQELIRELDNIE